MNCNELMIGDWVKWDNHHLQVQGTSLDDTYFGLDAVSDIIPNEELEPIPLTTEILEKNGFYMHDFGINTEMYYYAFPEKCGIPVERGFGIHEQNEVFFITDHCLMPIKFVHELQHALRLCGLNDFANNFKINEL